MKYWRIFLPAVAAGICIGIGGTVFLSCDNKIVGSLLFAAGLYMICEHGLNLFTGKVGYLLGKKADYLLDLAVIWLGNLAGTGFTALCLLCSRIAGIGEKAAALCTVKSGDSLLSLFLLAIFCGLLMYAAVEGYKRCRNPLLLFACVSAFILCGFEHCIADMFYYWAAGAMSADALLRLLVITLGNSLGGVLIPLLTAPLAKQ